MDDVNQTPLTDSKKAMWRAVVALANADGEVEPQEKVLLLDYIRFNKFPKDFEAQLLADMENPPVFDDCFEAITNPQDRLHVINAALVLFHSDGEFETAEKKLFQLLNETHRQQVDYKAAASSARAAIKKFEEQEVTAQKSAPLVIRVLDSVSDFLS